jgi:SAM-dependent methyltransferase
MIARSAPALVDTEIMRAAPSNHIDTLAFPVIFVPPPLQEFIMKKTSPVPMPLAAMEGNNRLKFAHFPSLSKAILCEPTSGPAGLRILDIGCGPGNLGSLCQIPAECKLFGVDLWPHQLRQAAEKGVYEALVQVNLVDGVPFANETFDIIVCNEVLMYLPNAAEILKELYRVSAPGGKLFVYNPITWFPRLHSLLKGLTRKIYRERKAISLDVQSNWKDSERANRITYYSFQSLLEQIRSVNFQVTEITGFRLFRNRIRLMCRLENFDWYRRLILLLSRRYPSLASDLFVVANKTAIGKNIPFSLKEIAA